MARVGNQMEMQWVVFDLCGEFYGVEISHVESIIKSQAVTRVPHMPVYMEGVMNLRGKVVSVIDLQKRFGEAQAGSRPNRRAASGGAEKCAAEKHIMIVNLDGNSVGLVVDEVTEVLTIDTEQIELLSPVFNSISVEYFKGVAKAGARLIILIDLPAVLTLEEEMVPPAGMV
jgi:purine-binding chemotaxis protein CheW